MEAIVVMMPERRKQLSTVYTELGAKLGSTSINVWFDDYKRKPGYAHYEFSGTMSAELIKMLGRTPTSDEIIMLVDNGFSHFGATCSINGYRFSGRVNTD